MSGGKGAAETAAPVSLTEAPDQAQQRLAAALVSCMEKAVQLGAADPSLEGIAAILTDRGIECTAEELRDVLARRDDLT